jgi:mannose-1-phosphate guanylyltransferase / phosphomannomutase
MRAVLMAGGSGTRLRPLTCDLPKPMVTVLNRPIIEHILHLLKRHGIHEVITTLHYLPDVIRDYFGDGSEFGMQMRYVVEEDQPLGTSGCVKNVQSLLDSTFVVISGDSVTDFDLTSAIHFHKSRKAKATLILKRVSEPMAFGLVITGEDQRICRFLEKPSTSEIFSDTVNTGTYILEPEVLSFLDPHVPSDFSQDLFPRLLAENIPMYGYVTSDYWCDIGSLEVYRQAQYDAIRSHVRLQFPYQEMRRGVWVGQNTLIDPTARIEAPAMIGSYSSIGARVSISAGTIIGDYVAIAADADLQRPIICNGAVIGEEAQLWACIIARNARIGSRSHISEGAVVGANSVVGEEAHIYDNIRIWNNKKVESGATLNSNLIFGAMATRNVFGHQGVSGLANVEITPEFAVKLGAAYGATLKPGAQVMVSRDQRTICHMVTRALISGMMSVGVNVQNLETTAIPIARLSANRLNVAGGIHVRVHPDKSDHILIEFLDANGINIDKPQEKKIEGAYFKEDFRRARIEEIGEISYPTRILEYYNSGFAKHLNVEAMRNSSCRKIVVDYVYAVSGAVLPRILGKFNSNVIVLNASLSEVGISTQERCKMLEQLQDVVTALRANFGVQVFSNGEKLILIDETGYPIQGELLTGVVMDMALTAAGGGVIIVPVSTSSIAENLAVRHHAKVIRSKANPTGLMMACHNSGQVVLGGSAEMGFIFPQLHPGFDSMFCIAKVIEWLTIQERTLSQVRLNLPQIYHRSQTVRCPWNMKGALMRHLVESYDQKHLELIDGVKIFSHSNTDWVLVLPDASEPMVRVFANVDALKNGERNHHSNQPNPEQQNSDQKNAETVEQNMINICQDIESFCSAQASMAGNI